MKHAFFIILAICIVIGACVSADTGVRSDIQSSAEQLGELREQHRQLTQRIEREQELREQLAATIGRAEANAESAGDDIRAAINLLTEYKYRLDQYFKAVDRLKYGVKETN